MAIGNFITQIKQWFQTKVAERQTHNLVVKVVIPLHTELVRITPKDTGRAASGWTTSFGSPSSRNPGIPGSQAAGVTDSMNQLASVTRNHPKVMTANDVFIANNVPYLKYLNYGRNGKQHSFKAPLHFVEMTVERITRGVR